MRRHNWNRIVVAAGLVLAGAVLYAQSITIPNTFTNGTVADGPQVNANFSALSSNALNRNGGTMLGTLNSRALTPTSDATYDVGTSSLRYRDGFFSRNVTIVGTLTWNALAYTGPSAQSVTSYLSNNGSGTLSWGAGTPALQGKQTLWVPASAMAPTITNGASGPSVTELTAANPNIYAMSFTNGSVKNAQFAVAFPKSWNAGTITFQAFWTGTAAGAGTTIWGLQCLAAADGATIDAAFGTAQEVTDTFLSTKQAHVAAESSAVTISGAAADTFTTCQVYRKGGTDTRAAASLLLGIKLFFTTNAGNDA
jgi:hypothetical protein